MAAAAVVVKVEAERGSAVVMAGNQAAWDLVVAVAAGHRAAAVNKQGQERADLSANSHQQHQMHQSGSVSVAEA